MLDTLQNETHIGLAILAQSKGVDEAINHSVGMDGFGCPCAKSEIVRHIVRYLNHGTGRSHVCQVLCLCEVLYFVQMFCRTSKCCSG